MKDKIINYYDLYPVVHLHYWHIGISCRTSSNINQNVTFKQHLMPLVVPIYGAKQVEMLLRRLFAAQSENKYYKWWCRQSSKIRLSEDIYTDQRVELFNILHRLSSTLSGVSFNTTSL